jgi:hypothetical protein
MYLARAFDYHMQKYPTFSLTSDAVTVQLEKDQAYSLGQEVQAGLSSPDLKRRDWAWERFPQLPINQLMPGDAVECIKELSKNEKEKYFHFVLKNSETWLRNVAYALSGENGKYRFHWKWKELDFRQEGECRVSADEKRTFFREVLAGMPFGYNCWQCYGSLDERKSDVILSFGAPPPPANDLVERQEYGGAKTFKAEGLWDYEISHNPQMKKWYDRLMKWQAASK